MQASTLQTLCTECGGLRQSADCPCNQFIFSSANYNPLHLSPVYLQNWRNAMAPNHGQLWFPRVHHAARPFLVARSRPMFRHSCARDREPGQNQTCGCNALRHGPRIPLANTWHFSSCIPGQNCCKAEICASRSFCSGPSHPSKHCIILEQSPPHTPISQIWLERLEVKGVRH